MAVEPGHTINRESFVSKFNISVRDWIQNQVVWDINNYPPNFPDPSANLSSKVLYAPSAVDIHDPFLTATALTTLMKFWCQRYTKIRKVHFAHRGNISGNILYEETQVASMAESYRDNITLNDVPIIPGEIASSQGWENWMEHLRGQLSNHRDQIINFEVTVEEPIGGGDADRGRR